MLNVVTYTVSVLFLSLILYVLGFVSYKTNLNKEKNSPFECGFDPTEHTRLRFCMKFFLIGVIFLIFDVEVTLLMPIPFGQTFLIMFLSMLIIGLLYEWYYGGLDWLA